MKNEHRRSERFDDIGRVDALQICPLPGVLDDISLNGCKVHFPIPVSVDMDNDFELKLKLSAGNASHNSLLLLCHPQWQRTDGFETQVGFKVLRSPDTRELESYIENLKAKSQDAADVSSLIIAPQVTFVS